MFAIGSFNSAFEEPICLLGYSSVSLILYLEGKRTVGHIRFADACDFRVSGDTGSYRGTGSQDLQKRCSHLISWLCGCVTPGFPSTCQYGEGKFTFVLAQMCSVVVDCSIDSIWRNIKMILYQQIIVYYNTLGYLSFSLKDTSTTWTDFKDTDDDSSCLGHRLVKFRE